MKKRYLRLLLVPALLLVMATGCSSPAPEPTVAPVQTDEAYPGGPVPAYPGDGVMPYEPYPGGVPTPES